MSTTAIEAKLLRYDLLKSGLDPKLIDLLAPPASFKSFDTPFAFKYGDSVIEEGDSKQWPAL